jgi:hypothetical protein
MKKPDRFKQSIMFTQNYLAFALVFVFLIPFMVVNATRRAIQVTWEVVNGD